MKGSCTGKSESYINMSRKALEKERLSSYIGSVRGTWRESSHTENSQ